MLVNKTVEFFLSEVAGRGRRSAVAGGGLGARCRWAGIGWQPDVTAADRCWVEADAGRCQGWARQWAGEMPAGAGAGQAAEPPETGATCLQGPRLGRRRNLQGPDEMPAGDEAGLAAEPPRTG